MAQEELIETETEISNTLTEYQLTVEDWMRTIHRSCQVHMLYTRINNRKLMLTLKHVEELGSVDYEYLSTKVIGLLLTSDCDVYKKEKDNFEHFLSTPDGVNTYVNTDSKARVEFLNHPMIREFFVRYTDWNPEEMGIDEEGKYGDKGDRNVFVPGMTFTWSNPF